MILGIKDFFCLGSLQQCGDKLVHCCIFARMHAFLVTAGDRS